MAANAGGIGAIEHAAVLVRDLDRAMEHYTNDLGIWLSTPSARTGSGT
jgi:hypothetical protein